jgi:hypothetical protein
LSIGSIISEKKEKYSQFGLDDKDATRAQVFLAGKASPDLDILIGKEGSSYLTTYVRFPGQDPVYLGNGFSSYILQRSTDAYRLKKLFTGDMASISAINLVTPKGGIELRHSSATWTRGSDGRTMDNGWVDTIKTKLNNLTASQFAASDTPEKDLGFAKPAIELTVSVASTTTHVVIGPVVADKNAEAGLQGSHCALVDGREGGILVIPAYSIKDITDFLKTAPQ